MNQLNLFPRCEHCGVDRGGVIDMEADGKNAPLLCFECHNKKQKSTEKAKAVSR